MTVFEEAKKSNLTWRGPVSCSPAALACRKDMILLGWYKHNHIVSFPHAAMVLSLKPSFQT